MILSRHCAYRPRCPKMDTLLDWMPAIPYAHKSPSLRRLPASARPEETLRDILCICSTHVTENKQSPTGSDPTSSDRMPHRITNNIMQPWRSLPAMCLALQSRPSTLATNRAHIHGRLLRPHKLVRPRRIDPSERLIRDPFKTRPLDKAPKCIHIHQRKA